MGQPVKRNVKRTHSSFLNDLKMYQDINKMIVQASNDTGACNRVTKCAEVVFETGKMVKDEGLQLLNERMKDYRL